MGSILSILKNCYQGLLVYMKLQLIRADPEGGSGILFLKRYYQGLLVLHLSTSHDKKSSE